MSDATKIAASPLTLDGLEFHPLDFGDLCDFENWVASQKMQTALAALNSMPETTPGDRVRLIQEITCADMSEATRAAFETLNGQRRLVYLSIKKGKPDITIDEVNRMLTTDNIARYVALVDAMTYPATTPGEGEDSDPPTKAQSDGAP